MRRVLRAYGLHNPEVGYCQGMNFLVGFLLEVVAEEASFWLLAALCEDINPGYYTPSMEKARSDVRALQDIIMQELPSLHTQATVVGFPLDLVLIRWLLVGFVNCFPPCTALRFFEVRVE
ncbi:unnamed protein product [Discosporangium mesarthrocarpum]